MVDILEYLNIPRVVATVYSVGDLEFLAASPETQESFDLLEFRLDRLHDHLDMAETLMSGAAVPILITTRHPAEGGHGNLNAEDRTSLLRRFLPLCDLIDLEMRFLDEQAAFAQEAREAGKTIVASLHDFENTPTMEILERVIASARKAAAGVAKISVHLDRHDDLAALARLVEAIRASGYPISAMGMGGIGKLSRLVLASAGSCLNYGYLREAHVNGQWQASELLRLYRELGLR